MHRHRQPVPGLAALPLDLPPLVQRRGLVANSPAMLCPAGRGLWLRMADREQLRYACPNCDEWGCR